MTGPRDPDLGPPSQRTGPDWPESDLRGSDDRAAPGGAGSRPEPSVGDAPITTGWTERGRDASTDRRRPTTAEQAVPWLIGVILLLVGMVIVLLALIFTSEDGMLAGGNGSIEPSPDIRPAAGMPSATPTPAPETTATPQATPEPEPEPTPTPTPRPTYGPLEMTYLARSTALGPAWIFRRDFSTTEDPVSVAQAEQGILRYDWAPDGTVGVAIISGRLVAITPGSAARNLGDDLLTGTFGLDAGTVYSVRVAQDGGNDVAEIVEVDFASGETSTLAAITYERPTTTTDSTLRGAQFGDDGGAIRLFVLEDGNVVLWVRNASTWEIDAESGEAAEIDYFPLLWSPDGRRRVEVTDAGGTTTLTLIDSAGRSVASTSATGLVSHLRWSPDSSQVVFTLGRTSSGGGVRQDLFIWDLGDGAEPMPLTNNGASFGAEWLGAPQSWRR